MRSTVSVAALALALCLAAPAGAATVRAENNSFFNADIYYEAAAGETNTVAVDFMGAPDEQIPGSTRVTDSTAPLTAGDGCWQGDAHTVHCPPGAVHVSLGDGHDRAEMKVVGGAPRQGPPFNGFDTVVLGGPGADRLLSTGPASFLAGEDGDDFLQGSLRSADGFAGGAGDDVIRSLDVPVEVQLTGTPGVGLYAEDVFCGPGDDVVLPDPLDNLASSCERIGLS
jgi:hypothetical protein